MPTRPPIHQPIVFRPLNANVGKKKDAYYGSKEWLRLRQQALIRDSFVCQLQLEGCSRVANTADHKVERKQSGGDTLDNLRAVCTACHNRRHPERWRNRDS